MTYTIQTRALPTAFDACPDMRVQALDWPGDTISLPVILAGREGDAVMRYVDATAMRGGCFLAAVPIGDCRYSAALQFGALFEWLRVDTVAFLPAEDFLSEGQWRAGSEIPAEPVLEDMEQVAPFLFHCAAETSFMMAHPPRRADGRPMMLAAVFRPLADRIEAPVPIEALSLPAMFDA